MLRVTIISISHSLVKTDNEDKEAVTSVFRMLFFLFVNHPSELLKLIFFSLLTFLLKFFRNTSLKISLSCAPAYNPSADISHTTREGFTSDFLN